MRIGIAHHLGWAVAITATDDHRVVDRRRAELIEPGLPVAPVHHEGGPHEMHRSGPPLSDGELATLVATVRAAVARATAVALDALAAAAGAPITSVSIRSSHDAPDEISLLRLPPHESRADSIMYLRTLAEGALARGWTVHRYDANRVEAEAAVILGPRAREVLHGPRTALGPPWTKDHRTALAATVVAVGSPRSIEEG